MAFIQTPVFTRQVTELLTDDERGGKSGGVRMIYYHIDAASQCRMLLIYRKGMKDDLTAAEKKTLRKLNENW